MAEQDRRDRARLGLERTLQRQIDSDTGLPRVNPWVQVEESATGQYPEDEAETQKEDLKAPIRREGLRELALEVSDTPPFEPFKEARRQYPVSFLSPHMLLSGVCWGNQIFHGIDLKRTGKIDREELTEVPPFRESLN